MALKNIIIDCDPGQDDAIALLLAFASRDFFNILGITTVAGNVSLEKGFRNARIIAELANIVDIPILAGCDRPLKHDLVTAQHVHGATGIDGIDIFEPSPTQAKGDPDQHGVDFIIETLKSASDKSVTLVPTGPLTNIASALNKAPEITKSIEQIVLMGGAMREGGNITPSAEFNIYVDPDAADIVLKSALPIVMHGLDVTHKVLCTKERLERIRAYKTPVCEAAYNMLSFFNRFDQEKYGSPGAPLHDPCTLVYLLDPTLFKSKLCNVEIETQSPLTRGESCVDFWQVTNRQTNVEWVFDVDAEGFFDLLIEKLGKL